MFVQLIQNVDRFFFFFVVVSLGTKFSLDHRRSGGMSALAALAVVLNLLPRRYGLFELDVVVGFDGRCLGLVDRNPISV